MEKTIVLVGTLDTKETECKYVKENIERQGCKVILVDNGVRGNFTLRPDITRQEVARAAGTTIEELVKVGKKEDFLVIEAMKEGLVNVTQELYRSGKLDGIISLGGSLGTALATPAMRSLPFGIPKVMVSTIAFREMRPYIGTRDIAMFYSVTDIAGLNILSRRLLGVAAGAIVGMVMADPGPQTKERPVVSVTTIGPTTSAASYVKTLLEDKGHEVIIFHSVSVSVMALEEFVEQGLIDAVFDLSVSDLVDHLYGGIHDGGPHRMEAAASSGLPQVVVPGNVDFIRFYIDKVPERFKSYKFSRHHYTAGIVRPSSAEMKEIACALAGKLNKASGPRAVVIPMKGFSDWDREGGVTYDPEADSVFVEELCEKLNVDINVTKIDANICDRVFAEEAVRVFWRLIER